MSMNLRVCIDVDDVERGIAFFTKGLGLHVGRRFDDQWVELLGASAPLDLLANPAGSEAVPGRELRRDYGRHWSPVHLDFVVDDIEAAVARAVAAGATLERPVRDEPYGRLANLADPFGNGICLLQMSERGYDALVR
jgi:predicted enzyme related to lactoylglutathione lyase